MQEEKLERLRKQVRQEEETLQKVKEKSSSEIECAHNALQDSIFEFKKATAMSRLVGTKRKGDNIAELEKMVKNDLLAPDDDPIYPDLVLIFSSRPEGSISSEALAQWEKLGPINLRNLVRTKKLKIMPNCPVKSNQKQRYWGQKDFSGLGRYIYKQGILEGQFENEFLTGFGRWIYSDGSYYIGYFSGDKREGEGTYVSEDSTKEGLWKDDDFVEKGEQS